MMILNIPKNLLSKDTIVNKWSWGITDKLIVVRANMLEDKSCMVIYDCFRYSCLFENVEFFYFFKKMR